MTNANEQAGAADDTLEELGEEELEAVHGGIGLLLPAVQKVREAALTESRSFNYTKV